MGLWLLLTLLFIGCVPAYAEWVLIGANAQAGSAVAQLSLTQGIDRKPAAVDPVPKTESWWTTRHEHTLARIHQGRVELLLIGDSITQLWDQEGRRIWDAYYERRHAVNLGYSGDRTEHVLWRLDHGEIERLLPSWRSC